jgi:hypothetical protein
VIPESKTDVLVSADCVNLQHLLMCYMSDVKHQLQVHDLQTGSLMHQLHLEIGSVTETSSHRQYSEQPCTALVLSAATLYSLKTVVYLVHSQRYCVQDRIVLANMAGDCMLCDGYYQLHTTCIYHRF